jgi:formylglycine-generating enzyme required for sulfatase activity
MSKIHSLISSAFAVISSLTTISAIADDPASTKIEKVETMPDGNLRDPRPSPQDVIDIATNAKKNLIFLSGATFDMGDWGTEVNEGGLPFSGDRDSKPLHKVKLESFSIDKYPVTYANFDIFTAALRLPRVNQDAVLKRYREPNSPAGVSWQGAKDYCLWLGKITDLTIDLPSEAQWEFAARSGGKNYVFPTDNGKLETGRNIPTSAQADVFGGLVPVGKFPPNPAGIYDMGSTIREWTNDWYAADYYQNSPVNNPTGPSTGTTRVVRGNFGTTAMTFARWSRKVEEKTGDWTSYAKTASEPDRNIPHTKYSSSAYSGFRCVTNSPKNQNIK